MIKSRECHNYKPQPIPDSLDYVNINAYVQFGQNPAINRCGNNERKWNPNTIQGNKFSSNFRKKTWHNPKLSNLSISIYLQNLVKIHQFLVKILTSIKGHNSVIDLQRLINFYDHYSDSGLLWLLVEYFSDNKFSCHFPSFCIHFEVCQFSAGKRIWSV